MDAEGTALLRGLMGRRKVEIDPDEAMYGIFPEMKTDIREAVTLSFDRSVCVAPQPRITFVRKNFTPDAEYVRVLQQLRSLTAARRTSTLGQISQTSSIIWLTIRETWVYRGHFNGHLVPLRGWSRAAVRKMVPILQQLDPSLTEPAVEKYILRLWEDFNEEKDEAAAPARKQRADAGVRRGPRAPAELEVVDVDSDNDVPAALKREREE